MNCSILAVLFTPAFIHKQSFQYVHEKNLDNVENYMKMLRYGDRLGLYFQTHAMFGNTVS